jgi:hypothetical protein
MRVSSPLFSRAVRRSISCLIFSSLAIAVACSSGDTDPDGSSSGGGSGRPSSGGTSNGSSSGISGFGSSTGGIMTPDGCTAVAKASELGPVKLVMLVDVSGSMGDDTNGKRTRKWDPTVAALKGFVTGPSAKGLTASLNFFPQKYTVDGKVQCQVATYATPVVPFTALPSPVLEAKLTETSPVSGGETPSDIALEATYAFARANQSADAKMAVLFVTDGAPCDQSCGDPVCPATINQARLDKTNAVITKAAAEGIKTFVIGITEPTSPPTFATILDGFAKAGGTTKAIAINTGDPAATQATLSTALGEVRGQTVSCDLKLPAPPPGQTFDKTLVNVSYRAPGATMDEIVKNSPNCKDPLGWQYDNADMPKSILLCPGTCAKVQSGTLNVNFGCATQASNVN